MVDIGIDFLLNLVAEIIGIVITVVIIDRILRKREEKKTKSFKENMHSRIADHCRVLSTLVQILAQGQDAESWNILKEDITSRKKQLLELSQISETVLELSLKNQLLELDRRLDILLSVHDAASASLFPREEWNRVIDDTVSQIIVVSRLVGDIGTSIGSEVWLEVFRSKSSREE